MKTHFSLITILLAGITVTAQAEPRTRYVVSSATATRLPVLAGSLGEAYDINEAGMIVGWSRTTSGSHAVKWTGGVIQDLDPSSYSSAANAINEFGTIVGFRMTSATAIKQPVHYGSVLITPMILPATVQGCVWQGEAHGINDQGVIVGGGRVNSSGTCAPQGKGLYWTNYLTVPVEVYGANVDATLYDVNNAGKAVGRNSDVNIYYQGASWQGGVMRPLKQFFGASEPFFYSGSATAINEFGSITGRIHLPGSVQYGVIWFTDGADAWNIGHFSPANITHGVDINDQWFITGDAQFPASPSSLGSRAFLWHSDFGLYALPLPATMLSCQANGMTNLSSGRILVVGGCRDSVGLRPVQWDVRVRTVSTSA